jgi:predicted nucleic acid-binding protein
MGVFLDTSVPIQAQRLRMSETAMLTSIRAQVGNTDLASSTIVLTELLVGVARGKSIELIDRRRRFVEDFLRDVPIHPYLQETAELAGRIGSEQSKLGFTVPFVDLMIAATALSLNYSVLTANVRHFTLIPGLQVIPF